MQSLRLLIFLTLFVSGCKTTVKTEDHCGDQYIDPGEACDGAELGEQTCATAGYYEAGAPLSCKSDCTLDTSLCGARCGDNVVDVAHGETCDSQQLSGNTCITLGFSGGVLACGADCAYDSGGCTSVCGNGSVEPDEDCDDGDEDTEDGCNALCEVELGWFCEGSPSVCVIVECGDDEAVGDELCDGSDLRGQSCESLNYHAGVLSCTSDCERDLSSCEAAGSCGDILLQPEYEDCDGDQLGGATCESLGYHGGTDVSPSCDLNCSFDLSACELTGRCGDGVLQTVFEDCDGEVPADVTCASRGSFSGAVTCGGDCQYDTSSCRDAVALALGDYHACVIDSVGAAWCWGEGTSGRLGDGAGTTAFSPVPVTMPAGVTFTAISAGTVNTCALDATGAAWCWGQGSGGKNGNGSNINQLTPAPVTMPPGRTFVLLDTGSLHSCAIDDLGKGWCWGTGTNGQLGTGGATTAMTPVAVAMPVGVTFTAISAGYGHTCAINTSGVAYCWGLNSSGQLGIGSTTPAMTPTLVPGAGDLTDLHAGYMSTCAVTGAGGGYCWGEGSAGQLGYGQPNDRTTPTAISLGGDPLSRISIHSSHACAITLAGRLFCWGNNEFGQLGRTGSSSYTPIQVSFGGTGLFIEAGLKSTCAINAPGRVFCWGSNEFGQLGIGSAQGTGTFSTPIPVEFP